MIKRYLNPVLVGFFLLAVIVAGCRPAPTATYIPSKTPSASATSEATATAEPSSTPVASSTPTCLEQRGIVEQWAYSSSNVGREVPLWAYLPPCYALGEEGLPVGFFFHGKPFDQTHWLNLGIIEVYEQGLVADRWRRAVLIFPNIPEPLFSRSDGGPGSYEQEFMDVVLPAVAGRTQITSWQQRVHLAGISRGGIWALEIGMRQPQVFGRVAALSPSLAVNYPRPAYDPFELAQNPENHPENLLLLAGEQDWALGKTIQLADQLKTAGALVQVEIVAGDHQDLTWQQELSTILDYLFPPVEGGGSG